MSHRHNMRKHFGRRSKERYGRKYKKKDTLAIKTKIKNGEAKLIEQQSSTRFLYFVSHDDRTVKVVYDSEYDVLVTALNTFPGETIKKETRSRRRKNDTYSRKGKYRPEWK